MKINRNNKTVLLFSCRWWPVFQTEGCFPGNWERMQIRPSSGWSGQPTVSAAASPERWGIQDFGWDCILPATSQTRSGQDSAAFSSAVFMVNRLKELFGGEPLPELHLFTAMAAASSDVNKWKRNLTQEMSTEPNDESEPDEPEFETSFRFQQEGDIVAVYNVEDFFFSISHQDHQWGRGNSQFLGEGGSKDGVVVYRWPCSEDYTQISSAVVFAKNLQLAPSSLSPGMFVLCWILQEFIWQISSTQMLFTVKSPVDRVNWLQITAL